VVLRAPGWFTNDVHRKRQHRRNGGVLVFFSSATDASKIWNRCVGVQLQRGLRLYFVVSPFVVLRKSYGNVVASLSVVKNERVRGALVVDGAAVGSVNSARSRW
jgi:hypothetical protein